MKKLILVFTLGLMVNLAIAQTSNSCVSCNNNVIDTTKFSSAVGSENTSTGLASFASGYQNQALGETANAFGINNLAAGKASFACGLNSEAIEKYSFAFGDSAIAWSKNSIALGKNVSVFGAYSFGAGENVKTTITSSMVIGSGFDDYNPLVNNINKSLMIGFNSYKPTLFVGGAVGNGLTGKVGIGEVTDPQAKLHIRADTLEIASVLIEPGLSSNSAYLYLGNNNYGLKYSPTRLEFLTGGKYVFYDGNVGIGTYQPAARLHVDGDFQVGDSLNPKPIRLYGSINAEGENAVSFGQDNTATGDYSFAGGFNSHALGFFSYAFGNQVTADGANSLAFGRYVKALASETLIFGIGVDNSNFFVNNIPSSLMIGFNSNLPTFFVKKSFGPGLTGQIGIGNAIDPEGNLHAKLHIKGDDNEPFLLFIEPNNEAQSALLNIGTAEYGLKYAPTRLEFLTGEKYVFYDGNVGIGTYQPEAKLQIKDGDIFIEDIDRGIIMKSPDGNCWRGTLDNTGSLHFVQVNCDDLQTGQPEPQPEKPSKTNIYPNPAGDRVYVYIDEDLLGSILEISDMNGKILLNQKLVNSESMIDLTNYHTGMYIFNITDASGKKLESKKISKN